MAFSSNASSYNGLNSAGEIFALSNPTSYTALTQASSNLQTLNQLDVFQSGTTASQTLTLNLSGSGGLTLTQGLRWGWSGTSTQVVIQGPGSLTVNGTFRGDLNVAGGTGGTARGIFLNGDATAGQVVTFNPTSNTTWTAIGAVTLSGRVTLQIANAAAIDAGSISFASGSANSSLIITGASGATFDRDINFSGSSVTGGTQTIGVNLPGSGSATFSSAIFTDGTNNTVVLSAATGDTAKFTGVIFGSRPITIAGEGTVALSTTNNTQSGLTTVSSGATLLVSNASGSATGSGAVVVNASGTLTGSGSVNASTHTITINGILSPGSAAGVGNFGTIHLASANSGTGALTLTSTSILSFDITSTITKDLVSLSSTNLTLGGGTLALHLPNTSSTGIDYALSYTIFTGASSLSGAFGDVTGFDNADYAAHFTFTAGNYDVFFTPVPEPATWIGGALAVGVVGWSVLKRRKAETLKS